MSTKSPRLVQPEYAEKISKAVFQGAQLDSFVMRSIEMVVRFENSDSKGKLRGFRISSVNHVDRMNPYPSDNHADFHSRRKLLLPELYSLLGEEVVSARLDNDQRLIVSFANDVSLIFSNEPEEVFDPLDVNWSLEFDDGLESAQGVRSLSCILSETGEAEFYECAE